VRGNKKKKTKSIEASVLHCAVHCGVSKISNRVAIHTTASTGELCRVPDDTLSGGGTHEPCRRRVVERKKFFLKKEIQSLPSKMPRKVSAWKDDASANEVARWFELQDTIGKSSQRHAAVLDGVRVPKPAVPRPQSAVLRCARMTSSRLQ
jgi:hypothetical protein